MKTYKITIEVDYNDHVDGVESTLEDAIDNSVGHTMLDIPPWGRKDKPIDYRVKVERI